MLFFEKGKNSVFKKVQLGVDSSAPLAEREGQTNRPGPYSPGASSIYYPGRKT